MNIKGYSLVRRRNEVFMHLTPVKEPLRGLVVATMCGETLAVVEIGEQLVAYPTCNDCFRAVKWVRKSKKH